MHKLEYWQNIIQTKRKQTPWRDFVRDVCSWKPLNMYQRDGMISRFPESTRAHVVPKREFYAMRDELSQYGADYKNTESFFEQFGQLLSSTPLPSMIECFATENSEYCDIAAGCKNAYLGFTIFNNCENVCYSADIKDNSHNVFNSMTVWDGNDNIYQSTGVFSSQQIFYSKYITSCFNIWFSSNLRGCQECLFCDGLENQSYCIANVRYEKEEYLTRKEELLAKKHNFALRHQEVNKKAINFATERCSGNMITQSNNIEEGHFVYRVQEGKNLFSVWSAHGNSHFYDVIDAGSPHGNHYYAVQWAGGWEHIYCSVSINWWSNVYYSYYLDHCNYCLGCVGLINKEYCILNKQYSRDEWLTKVEQIFSQMHIQWVLGRFFPPSLNPFFFNDTAAALIGEFKKEELIAEWYLWRDEEIKVDIPEWMELVESKDLNSYESNKSWQWFIDPSILKKVIRDQDGNCYRIVKIEYDFLMKFGLPLPREHRLERLKGHFRR